MSRIYALRRPLKRSLHVGTVITIHPDTTLKLTTPIADRLRQSDSGLRTSSDASLLIEGIIDLSKYTL